MITFIMDLNKCFICFLASNGLTSVDAVDSNNVKWSTKIMFVVPELEKIDHYLICNLCTHKLEEFINYKHMLLNSINKWKSICMNLKVCFSTEHKDRDEENQSTTTEPTNILTPSKNYNYESGNDVNEKYDTSDDIDLKDDPIDDPQSPVNQNQYCDVPIHIPSTEYENHVIDKCYKCNNCNNFYMAIKNLQAHEKYCTKLNNSEPILQSNASQKKIRDCRSRRTFVCEVCNEKYNRVRLIIDHYSTVHSYSHKDIKPFPCERCDQKFSTLTLLHQHLKYHNKDRSKMCTTCGKSFITSNDLLSHQYIHLNRRNYRCNDCDKAFNTNKNLRTHILVVHTDRTLWRYHCQICDKRFPQKTNFDQHSKRHSGDKQHVCHICEKRFISSSELKRHVQLHSNIKLFRCIPCDAEYKTKRSYNQHLDRKHTDSDKKFDTIIKEKKFVCHICPSQFYDKAKLVRHLCRHSGVKPHACSLCDKRFSGKSYLKQHLKLIHKLHES